MGFIIENNELINYIEEDDITEVIIPDNVKRIGPYAFEKCEKLTIYGVAGSYVETFAKNKNIPFQSM